MSEYEKTGKITDSAMKADVDRHTARKYIEAGKGPAELKAVFFRGFATNALNPKVALFFLAFLPQFIGPAIEHKSLAFLLLGLLFNLNGLAVNIGWAVAAAWLSARVAIVRKSLHWLERAAGAMFLGFGLKLALADNPQR